MPLVALSSKVQTFKNWDKVVVKGFDTIIQHGL